MYFKFYPLKDEKKKTLILFSGGFDPLHGTSKKLDRRVKTWSESPDERISHQLTDKNTKS